MKDKKRDKRGRDEDLSQEGSLKRGEVSKHQETLSLVGLQGVLESIEFYLISYQLNMMGTK